MPDRARPDRLHAVTTQLAWAAAGAVAAQFLPSLCSLAQWLPAEAAPGGLCRWRGPSERSEVAFTFDDGPHPEATPALLDQLDTLEIRATFFPIGSMVERYPELVAEVVRRGHLVGTHGYRHGHHLVHGPRWVRRDLDAAEEAMARVQIAPTWYRPTYGQVTASTLAAARAKGWRPVLWSAWGREWATSRSDVVAARIISRLRAGAVVLLHDSDRFGPTGMWRTGLDALARVGEELERRSLVGVTLDQLVR